MTDLSLFPTYIVSRAVFDSTERYRYRLTRIWDLSKPLCGWIMLNPSTADAETLDPTVRRCVSFARSWGCGGIEVGNLFALRSTDPKALYAYEDPVGWGNDKALHQIVRTCAFGTVAAWGVHGAHRGREEEVRDMLPNLLQLGLTQDGHPKHPLYLRAGLRPEAWNHIQCSRCHDWFDPDHGI